MKLFDLFATLVLDTSGFSSGVNSAQEEMSDLSQKAEKATKKFAHAAGTVGKTVGNTAKSIITTMDDAVKKVVVGGTGAMIAAGTSAVNIAADIAAENAAFEATFGDMAEEAKTAYAVVGDQANILDARLQKTATKGFSQLKGAGMSANDALDASTRLLTLAADGAAYYDMSLEDTDERLRSFLRGNTEAGDSIGLFTSEMQRNNKAMELYGVKWQELTESQRQMTMLNIAEEIYKQADVTGQAAREAEGWANVVGNLKEAWRQTVGIIGTPIMDNLSPIIQSLTETIVAHKGDVETFAGKLDGIIKALTTGNEAEGITAGFGLVTDFLDEISAAIDNKDFWGKGNAIFASLMAGFDASIDSLKPSIATIAGNIGPWIVEYSGALLVGGLNLISGIAQGLTDNKDKIGDALGDALQDITQWISDNGASIVSGAIQLVVTLAETIIENAPSLLWEAGVAIVRGLWDGIFGGSKAEENPITTIVVDAMHEVHQLSAELAQSQQTYANMLDDAKTRNALAEAHLKTIELIEGKDIKSDDDMYQLQNAVAALNALYPELKIGIDDTGTALNTTTAEIRSQINALNDLAIANATAYITQEYESKIGEFSAAYVKAKKAESEATEELAAATARLQELQTIQPKGGEGYAKEFDTLHTEVIKSIDGLEEYYQVNADGSSQIKDEYVGVAGEITDGAQIAIAALVQDAIAQAEETASAMQENVEDAQATSERALNAVNDLMAEYQGDLETARQIMDETMGQLEEPPEMSGVTDAVDAAEEALDDAAEAAGETAEAVENALPAPDTAGVTSACSTVMSALDSLKTKADAVSAALNGVFTGSHNTGLHAATGLERVPYDGFPAVLHKDEMVLSRAEADQYRTGAPDGHGGLTVVQNIQSVPQTARELAFATANALEMLRFDI